MATTMLSAVSALILSKMGGPAPIAAGRLSDVENMRIKSGLATAEVLVGKLEATVDCYNIKVLGYQA